MTKAANQAFRDRVLVKTGHGQKGLTLVELMVAMAISLVVAIAAVASLLISRQGFSAVDASSQLRDNARFVMDLIQRIGVQAGYQDVLYIASPRQTNVSGVASNPDPNIFGVNNKLPSVTDPFNTSPTTAGINGSDILMIRYQTGETFPGSGVSDRSMIDCMGNAPRAIPHDQDDRLTSVFFVKTAPTGEPSLYCSTGPSTEQPIIQGVENFQVLYGVDGVTANTASTVPTDSIAERYLRADQMTVAGNVAATNDNWRRVRTLRIGMVLRGPVGSVQDPTAQTFYPLGLAKNSSGTLGGAMSSTSDVGTIFSPTADRRLRQVVTFTVHLRNEQGLKLQAP